MLQTAQRAFKKLHKCWQIQTGVGSECVSQMTFKGRCAPACYYGACINVGLPFPPWTCEGSINQTNLKLPARLASAVLRNGVFRQLAWRSTRCCHVFSCTCKGSSTYHHPHHVHLQIWNKEVCRMTHWIIYILLIKMHNIITIKCQEL